MKKADNYTRAYVYGGIALLIVIGGSIILYNLVNASLAAAKEVKLNTIAADAYDKRLGELSALKSNYEALLTAEPRAREIIENAVPDDLSFPRYLIALKNLRDQFSPRFSYKTITQTDPLNTSVAAATGYKTAVLLIDIDGISWTNFLKFLDQIEHSARLASVSSVKLGSGAGGVLSASVTVEIFYRGGASG